MVAAGRLNGQVPTDEGVVGGHRGSVAVHLDERLADEVSSPHLLGLGRLDETPQGVAAHEVQAHHPELAVLGEQRRPVVEPSIVEVLAVPGKRGPNRIAGSIVRHGRRP